MSKRQRGEATSIDIIGADANNLKNVDVSFPLRQISVVSGVSGSGKSSLLADTLAAEGSRRMRLFLGVSQQDLEREEVRAFIGPLPPTILVGQRGFRPSVRTTAGTATGFLSILRRLFVLESAPYSQRAQADVPPPSPQSYARWIATHYRGKVEIWAVPAWEQRTDGVAAVQRLAANRFEEVTIHSETNPPRLHESGRTFAISDFKRLNPNVRHTIEALAATLEVKGPSQTQELTEAFERAFAAGPASVIAMLPGSTVPELSGPFGPRLDAARHWVHPDDPAVYARPTSHLLSFNAPEHDESGACKACGGTGTGRRLREEAFISHPGRSMHTGAFAIWTEKNYKYVHIQHETIEGLRGMHGFSPDLPWSKLPASARALVLDGSGTELVFDRDRAGRKLGKPRPFPGFRKVILEKAATGTKVADQLSAYVEVGACEACAGTRWSPQARALRFAGYGISDLLGLTFSEVESLAAVRGPLSRACPNATKPLIEAIRRHAHSIVSVGLGYLTGDRGMLNVSEGESRRIRLARVLDAGERGFCLLLDEPARGLHEADLSGLALSLSRLRGHHTVILNEHRERLWETADWHVEVGPGAGAFGGRVTYAGPPRVNDAPEDGPLRPLLPCSGQDRMLAIRGASIHNVQNIDCEIPLGRLTCICGVSGSGKSSFVRGVLAPALLQAVNGETLDFATRQGNWRSITGTRDISQVVALDQAMPPAYRRSLVATFTGVFDNIRKVFGASPEAKRDGLTASDFGVNAGHGRCSICLGVGEVSDGDLWSTCPSCGGSRYGHAVLSVRIAGTNVQELLDTPVDDLGSLAEAFRIPQALITAMTALGIGYVSLGRKIDTLSGGEVQRLRLAMRLGVVSAGPMFFILDEPAVGLHARDVQRLAAALERVLDDGRNTIVIVEHDLRLIRSADWVIELGPGSGPDGGQIVFAGPPGRLLKAKTPTGLALAGKLSSSPTPLQEPGKERIAPSLPAEAQAARTTALVRTLVSGDAPVALETSDEPVEPLILVTERLWSGREPWEVAGLDREIPKLLLDVQLGGGDDGLSQVLAIWQEDPACWLAIQPFLSEIQVWGTRLPASTVRSVSSHVAREGLRLVTTKGQAAGKDFEAAKVRATGDRFRPAAETEEARRRVLRDAWAIGAQYVELRDRQGRLQATFGHRLLDLEAGLAAPMALVPGHFSRLDSRGRCPMCKGSRAVTSLSEAVVIGDRTAPLDSERFLTPQADAVMKGIRRNELAPFLRRLAKEGLWDLSIPFAKLDRVDRELILFGFWARPGAGSFLKTPRANPGEVSSWLRWDGLYRHVLAEADRSRDADWARRLQESASLVLCLRCEGSGLQRYAELLQVGDLSFAAWTRIAAPQRRLDFLRSVAPRTPRQEKTRERLLRCLEPPSKTEACLEPAAIVDRAVGLFTTMRSARAAEPQRG